MRVRCSSGTARPGRSRRARESRSFVATPVPPCDNRLMNSRRALGVGPVLILPAAVWAVARVAQRPAMPAAERAVSPATAAAAPAPEGKVALQFYRAPAPVAAIAMKDLDG